MIMSFGVEQARQASKFAKTVEQKRTVLATMAMLGIKNKIAITVKKGRDKLLGKVARTDQKLDKLDKKYQKTTTVQTNQLNKLTDIRDISVEWTL